MSKITPIILCGGSGTRLWPVSRQSFPKQFIALIGDTTLFQQCATRLSGAQFNAPLIVTNSDFRFIATQQLAECGVDPAAVLLEPSAKNTAPALLAAALLQARTDENAVLLAAPSDHLIHDTDTFRDTIARGVASAQAGRIVTFGIRPDRPETGYGYLEVGAQDDAGANALKRFVEKPEKAQAQQMIDAGGYLWNAGLFMFTVATLIDAYKTHAPDMFTAVTKALDLAKPDLGFLRLDADAWQRSEAISVDFAIMEKHNNISVVEHSGDWSDLGGWAAVHKHTDKDAKGVALHGAAMAVDCENTLLRSESGTQQLVGLGLQNIIAIAMPDAVLIADAARVGEVGELVKSMRKAGVAQADMFPKSHRPWGYFDTLVLSDRFQVKRIVVNPGGVLSLQSHVHRSEHWIVVAGTAKVTIDDKTQLVGENQSIYIPLGAVHRMENPGKVAMELIEVQTGSYLGEDDITRYEDVYARD